MINNFDAAFRLLNTGKQEFHQKYPLYRNKLDLFFIDHEFVPLLVQECYLGSMQHNDTLDDIEAMANASDMISLGDEVNIQIRMNQNWALLPDYGTLSSVAPMLTVKGNSSYPYFPQILGKMSSAKKSLRLIRELKQKMADRVCTDRYSI